MTLHTEIYKWPDGLGQTRMSAEFLEVRKKADEILGECGGQVPTHHPRRYEYLRLLVHMSTLSREGHIGEVIIYNKGEVR